jgi:hypothetical protein
MAARRRFAPDASTCRVRIFASCWSMSSSASLFELEHDIEREFVEWKKLAHGGVSRGCRGSASAGGAQVSNRLRASCPGKPVANRRAALSANHSPPA